MAVKRTSERILPGIVVPSLRGPAELALDGGDRIINQADELRVRARVCRLPIVEGSVRLLALLRVPSPLHPQI
jgi:hypothetical protein